VATLLLTPHSSAGTQRTACAVQHTLTSPSLRAWLEGDWAIIFSHPDDFVRYDLEMDRWLVVTQRAFAARGIRPIALDSPALDPETSWVTQVIGDNRTVLLEDPTQQHFGPVDLQTPVLREALEQVGQRFVMIIDGELRQQKVFSYDTLSGLPSPLEFLGWAQALRTKQLATLQAKQASLGETAANIAFPASHALRQCTRGLFEVVASSSPQIRERKRGSSREQAGRGAGMNVTRCARRREMTL
jgi:alkyl hydroperoxide reductase subunit AhpC